VVLDANVLIPAPSRDVLLRAAEAALYRALTIDHARANVARHAPAFVGLVRDRLANG